MSKKITIIFSLFLILAVTFFISISIGSVSVSLKEILNLFSPENEALKKIIIDIRLPRLLNAMLVGAALSCSGIVLQSLLNNNLAEPGLLGISSGAGLGAILIFILPVSLPFIFITPVSFVFALASTLLIIFIARGIGGGHTDHISSNKIILTGIAISAFISSVNGLLMLISGSSVIQILYWLNGGFSGRGWNEFSVSVFFILSGLFISVLISKDLNVLSLGEEFSSSLGLNLKRMQRVAIFAASLLAASAVSVAGIISFVGLVIPNLSRLLIGNDHRYSVLCSILLGAIFMLLSDTIARIVIAPSELPVGIITSFIGAPVFVWLILKKKRSFNEK